MRIYFKYIFVAISIKIKKSEKIMLYHTMIEYLGLKLYMLC